MGNDESFAAEPTGAGHGSAWVPAMHLPTMRLWGGPTPDRGPPRGPLYLEDAGGPPPGWVPVFEPGSHEHRGDRAK